MAAVAGSGVNPVAMFKLISMSDEYGEICKEMQKVVDFIDVFGYDLTTAIKTVALATPSPRLKEYLNGIISTINSGGDIKGYLVVKSGEAMLAYRLEREKYTEAITTYSDMYTGILVAAPLFFIAALSLVSILGGNIGGISVDALVAFGTYVAIPILNIMFILFLELNQPQV
jgi:flagellar protein FlaJ